MSDGKCFFTFRTNKGYFLVSYPSTNHGRAKVLNCPDFIGFTIDYFTTT
ncbi:MAG: hypothetical protein GF311_11665 [Candidatus Lokiarchaeota archaeon]|nr:hypothetical protein [Candidatus Lokiarchaeota archaeon]